MTKTLTINEAMVWLKTLHARHAELVSLRDQNSANVTRHYGMGGDKTETRLLIKPACRLPPTPTKKDLTND